jgi:thiol-disulfide isomerase/thioredoxin
MRKIYLIITALILTFSAYAQKPKAVKFSTYKALANKQNDTTYVINFWATWCKPCVKELPYFEELNKKYASKKVKIILLSLDFVKDLNTKLIPFVQKNNIKSTVYLFDEPDYNAWIDKVEPTWGGAIPATMIINNSKHYNKFYEKNFEAGELEKAFLEAISE